MEKTEKANKLKEKEAKLNADKEKDNQFKSEIEEITSQFDKSKLGIKLSTYLPFLESILTKITYKTKDKEINELLGVSLCKIIDYGLKESTLANFPDQLSNENKTLLMKALYMIYERISNKANVFSIKSAKLLIIHNKLASTESKGSVARSLFSIQK